MSVEQATGWDRRLRDQIAQAVLRHESEVVFYGQVPRDGLFDAVQDMLDEHPEVFWIGGKSSMRSVPGQRVLQLEGLYPARSVERMQEELASALGTVTDYAQRGSSDLERVALVYEWLCTHLAYVPSALAYEDQTSYAALCLRQAVCAGFARGFQLAMMALGIEGGVVVGGSDLRALDRHAWNYVVLDGMPLHLDVTAGVNAFERTGVLSHSLFLLPGERVAGFRYVKSGPRGGQADSAPLPDLPFLVRCMSKKELRALLYRDCSQIRSCSGRRCALSVVMQSGVFSDEEQFRAYVQKLMSGSTAGMGFSRYRLNPGFVLELW